MKKIEEKTCIRFHRINPEPGKDWLLLMRVGRRSQVNGNWQSMCYADYINQNLRNQNFGDLGKVCTTMTMKLDTNYNYISSERFLICPGILETALAVPLHGD